ncbi:MAG TPA: hypothetical protein VGB99_00355 [Acidobacteriota bacterium]
MNLRVGRCPLIALAAFAGVASADTYLEFTQTVRSNERLVADYSHKIWIGAERARIDDSNAVTWLIRPDRDAVYRLDHREHSGAQVPSARRGAGFGCNEWNLQGEVRSEKLLDRSCEVRVYECAGLQSRRPQGAPAAGPSRNPMLNRMRSQKVTIWTSVEIPLDPDSVFATLSGAGIWSGLASIWASLPEPRPFPVQIETQLAQVQTVYRLVKLEQVEVEPSHYEVPSGYGLDPSKTESAAASQPAPSR